MADKQNPGGTHDPIGLALRKGDDRRYGDRRSRDRSAAGRRRRDRRRAAMRYVKAITGFLEDAKRDTIPTN